MDASPSPSPRLLTELTRGQSLRLLASVRLGRIVFTHRALPAIRPVNHLLDGEDEVIRTHPGAAIVVDTGPASGVVVAYEADAIDPGTGLGWSVIVTGIARQVTGHDDVARYKQLLQPWVAGDMSQVIRISPEIVTGYRLDPAT
jgi:hypothetical protein